MLNIEKDKTKVLLVLSFFGSLLLVFANILWPAYLLTIILGVFIFPVSMSLFKRALLSVLLFFSLTTIAGILFSIFKQPLQPSVLLTGILILLTTYLIYSMPNNNLRFGRIIDKNDILSIIIGIGTFIFLVTPFMFKSPAARLYVISRGEDNASHFALYNANIKNHGYTYNFSDNSNIELIKSLIVYPQALHLNMAETTLIIHGNHTPILKTLIRDYAFLICLYFALFTTLLMTLMLEFASYVSSKNYPFITGLVLIPFVFIWVIGNLLFYLYLYGFQSQIMSYSLILGSLYLLFHANRHGKLLFMVNVLFIISLATTWYFLLPIGLALLVIHYLIRKNYRRDMILLLILMPFIAYPVIVSALGGQATTINLPGGLMPVSPSWIICSILVATMMCLASPPHISIPKIAIMYIFFATTILFSLAICFYQIMSVGKLSYYFDKSLYTVAITGIIIGFGFASMLFEKISDIFSRPNRKLAVLMGLATTITIALTNIPYFQSAYSASGIPSVLDVYEMDILLEKYPINLGIDDYVFTDYCVPGYSYINSRWIGALYLNENPSRGVLEGSLFTGKDVNKSIKNYSRVNTDHNVTVYHRPCVKK